jgi:hypothetical protein
MIAVVAHDAGGAEILSSYVRREGFVCRLVLAGPALDIFARKLGSVEVTETDEALNECDWVLCGSSYPSDFELKVLAKARARGKRSVVFLDHWINYRERFLRNDNLVLPDEFFVGDEVARDIAHQVFPDFKVSVIRNPYFEDIKQKYYELENVFVAGSKGGMKILFVSQPFSELQGVEGVGIPSRGYDEMDSLKFLLHKISTNEIAVDNLIVRPHPAEKKKKYDFLIGRYEFHISVDGNSDLIEQMVRADVVVGIDSMALAVAAFLGKIVVSSIPIKGAVCSIPYPAIRDLEKDFDTVFCSGFS